MVAMAAAALAFTACNKTNDGVTPEVTGDSYASVRVDLTSPLKALNDGDQTDNKGTEAESKVVAMQMVGINGADWAEADITANQTVYTGKAKPVSTTGSVTTALLINANGLVTAAQEGATFGTADQAVANLDKLATDNSFAMSSKVMPQTIKPNITEANAPTENMLDFKDVERLVSKGIVQKDADYDNNAEGGTVDFSTVKYAAVNGATKIYAFLNNAGNRKMEVEDDNQYKGFTSAIHSSTLAATAEEAKTQNLVRRGNLGTELGKYASVNAADPAVTDYTDNKPGVNNGVYFLENSGELTADNKAKGFYRYAYAKIYATFVPSEILDIDTTGKAEFVALAGTGKKYKANQEGVYVESTEQDAVEGMLVYPSKKVENYTAGTTFYVGEKDGRFYISKNAAANSTVAPGQKAFTYTNGRAGYRALWNRQSPDADATLVNNADTRRNNIYVLNISKFQKLGMPWDPSDPNDPDLPKTDDPDEPDYPDNPNIEEQDTYVAAKANVVPWNVIGRKVILK